MRSPYPFSPAGRPAIGTDAPAAVAPSGATQGGLGSGRVPSGQAAFQKAAAQKAAADQAAAPPPAPPLTRGARWRGRFRRLRDRGRGLALVAMGVFLAFAVLSVHDALTPHAAPITERYLNDVIDKHMGEATPVPSIASRVYAGVWPSVVYIVTTGWDAKGEADRHSGSGVIVDEAGSILTSLHVVTAAATIEVYFTDGTISQASITAQQPANDIAVLSPRELPGLLVPATLGIPQSLRVGDEAVVVGSPFGIANSLSAGVISGLDRSFKVRETGQELQGLIQFDAAVNPGNSGGPLFNRDGEVVGIVTGLVNPTDLTFFVGIGFAVPIDVAASAGGPLPF